MTKVGSLRQPLLAFFVAAFVAPRCEGFLTFVHSIRHHFTKDAWKEFAVLMELAHNRPNDVITQCPLSTRPKSRCYGTYSQDFINQITERMTQVGCVVS